MGCEDIAKDFGIREEGVEEDIVKEGSIGNEDIGMVGIEESEKEEGGIDEDTISGFSEGTPADDIAAA